MTLLTADIGDQLKESLIPLEDLASRYNLTRPEFDKLLLTLEDPLKLEPTKICGTLYLTPLQVELLDSLKEKLKHPRELHELLLNLKGGALLYQCCACGELKLTQQLLTGEDLLHSCDLLKLRARLSSSYAVSFDQTTISTGRYELLASGPLDQLIQWTHSLYLNLDDSIKTGI